MNGQTNQSSPLLALNPVDSTNNFNPKVVQNAVVARPSPSDNNAITYDARYVRIALTRTVLTKFFVLSLWLTNWALTGVVVYITISANDGVEMADSILVLPLSVVVTIPTLRALWIGAPGFGMFPLTLWLSSFADCHYIYKEYC